MSDPYDSLGLPDREKGLEMINLVTPLAQQRREMQEMGLTYAEWCQTIEKPRLSAIPADVRAANAASHLYAFDGDSNRCISCEVAPWNGWKNNCNG